MSSHASNPLHLDHSVGDRHDLRLGLARQMMARRSIRAGYFKHDLFGEPAWDMMLDLYVARHRGRPLSVTGLCLAAGVPTSTALRWIRDLTGRGLIERTPDPADARRSFVALSPPAIDAFEAYLDACLPPCQPGQAGGDDAGQRIG